VRSTHDADEWTHVVTRMKGYSFVSMPIKPQRMLDEARAGKPEDYRKIAEYLATINLSAVDRWEYPLKTLPRPSGRATRAIVTEYDMKRPTTQPHNVLRDKDGNVWYSDFGERFISKFDPKTLKLTEYPIKEFKPGAPVGQLSLELDHQGNFWFDTMYQGSLGNLNPKTGEIKLLKVRNQQGQMVPLGTLLRVDNSNGPLSVMRYNMYASAAVNGNMAPGVSSGDVIRVLTALAQQLGVAFEWTQLIFLQVQAGNVALLIFVLGTVLVYLVSLLVLLAGFALGEGIYQWKRRQEARLRRRAILARMRFHEWLRKR